MNRPAILLALSVSSLALAQPASLVADDRALLQALLAAQAPAPEEIRALAVEDLGLLGDVRALNTLAGLLRDEAPAVRAAAVRAVRAIRAPRAEQVLTELVRDRNAPELLKQAALEALAYQGSASSRAFLASVRDDVAFSARLQGTARAVLERLAVR